MKKKKKRNGILQILSKPLVTQVDNNDDNDDDVTNVLILPKKVFVAVSAKKLI